MGAAGSGNLLARALFERCAAGEDAAWREFLDAYRPLFLFLARREHGRAGGGDPARVEDAVEEVLAALLARDGERLRRYDPRWRPSTWLALVAVGVIRDGLRRSRRLPEPVPDDSLEALLGERGAVASDAPERRESLARLRAAVAALPARERLAVGLCYRDGLTTREAGRVLRASAATVSRLLAEARRRLRGAVRGREGPDV